MAIKTVAFDTPTEMTKIHIVTNDVDVEMTKVHVVVGGVPTTVFTSTPAVAMIIPSLLIVSDTSNSITFRMINNEPAGTGADAYFYYEIWNDAETSRLNTANTVLDGGTLPQDFIDKTFGGLSSNTAYKLRVYSEDVLLIKPDSDFSEFVRNVTDTVDIPPATPTNLTVDPFSETSTTVDLFWTDNAVDETGYRLLDKPSGGIWTVNRSLSANTTAATATNLEPNK